LTGTELRWRRATSPRGAAAGAFARLIRRKLADPDWRWLRTDKVRSRARNQKH
jgi:hypothetical protein